MRAVATVPARAAVAAGDAPPARAAEAPSQLADAAARLLQARLKAAAWSVAPGDEPLALCFCLLIGRLDPLIAPRSIAAVLRGAETGRFDEMTLINAMARLGFRYLRLRAARPVELDPRLLPALVRGPAGGWSVCHEDRGVRRLYDGTDGSYLPPAELDRRSEVLIFSRIRDEDLDTSKARRDSSRLSWFQVVLRRFLPHMRAMLALGIGLNLLSLMVPALILIVHAEVIDSGDGRPLAYLTLGAALLVGIEIFLRRLRSRFAIWMMARLDYLVGVASFDKLLGLSAGQLGVAGISSQIARIKTFEAVRDFLCGPLLVSAMELPMTVLAVGLLIWLGGVIVLPALAAIVVLLAVIFAAQRAAGVRIREAAVESSRMQQFTLDTFAKLDAIRLDGLADKWLDRFRELSGREQMAALRMSRIGAGAEIVAHLVLGLSTIATLYVGATHIWAGAMGPGALIASVMLQIRALSPLHAVVGMVPRLEQLKNAVIQIDRLMEMEEEDPVSGPRTTAMVKLGGQITLVNIALRYGPKAPMIFSGLNLEIAQGETIAITGPNGSGKSSLLKLPLSLVVPQFGAVRIGGFDIRQLNPAELREQVAYYPQYVDLFSGTLAENLRLAMPIARNRDLEEALEAAGAMPAVRAMPGGLETHIDPVRIAATMPLLRERIGLARALLRDGQILLIDERPTMLLLSGLDADIARAIEERAGRRTTLFVSYRTDFLRRADRVIALFGDGRAQVGTLDKIMRKM
ncbi:peptidase domain-containing ABC transporter [Frigidibacter sp. MR17.24]|uniref:peptidase domain-containing ABC transporter n=1 Tax=Frigidibacter sp. MR17.24 TaxID=3127345 RepID=UPI003012E823